MFFLFFFFFHLKAMLAHKQMVIHCMQINLVWKLEESPNQKSREVLERLSDWSSHKQNHSTV